MMRLVTLIALPFLLSACAGGFLTGQQQKIRIDTLTREGKPLPGASCNVKNDSIDTQVRSGGIHVIPVSKSDLVISCEHPQDPAQPATALLIARPGTAVLLPRYAYPAWVQLKFGSNLLFDKRHDTHAGKPTPGTAPVDTN